MAADAAADWRRAQLTDGTKNALASLGFRLEDDGRVLDRKTRALSEDQLAQALRSLGLSAQLQALERLKLILSKEEPSAQDWALVQSLKAQLPPDVAAAAGANVDLAALRRLADADISRLEAAFDGARSLKDRLAGALPVQAGPRSGFLPLDDSERRVGDALNAATANTLAQDPFGRTVLERLKDKNGRPDLPPLVVQDLPGAVASYDHRRGVIIVDRGTLTMSVTEDAGPGERAELGRRLDSRQALLEYLALHPEASASFAAKNDALLVHELTHAWQDRRDGVLREMARGNLPQALVLEFEEEAWMSKNQYIRSKLSRDTKASIDDAELSDYVSMTGDRQRWKRDLYDRYRDYSPAGALTLRQTAQVLAQRRERVKKNPAPTLEKITAKTLDLTAITLASRELAQAQEAESARLKEQRAALDGSSLQAARVLGEHYLHKAQDAARGTDAAAALSKAKDFALKAGDQDLLKKIRSAEGLTR